MVFCAVVVTHRTDAIALGRGNGECYNLILIFCISSHKLLVYIYRAVLYVCNIYFISRLQGLTRQSAEIGNFATIVVARAVGEGLAECGGGGVFGVGV